MFCRWCIKPSAKVYAADEPPPANRDFERRFVIRVQAKFQVRITLTTVALFAGAVAMAVYLTPNTSTPVLGPLSGYLLPIQKVHWSVEQTLAAGKVVADYLVPIHVHQYVRGGLGARYQPCRKSAHPACRPDDVDDRVH